MQQIEMVEHLRQARLKENKPLENLDNKSKERLSDLRRTICSNLHHAELADSMMPLMFSIMAVELDIFRLMGLSSTNGSETQLRNVAIKLGKPLHHLESIQEQIDALTLENNEDAQELADSFLLNALSPNTVRFRHKLVHAWEQGQSDTLSQQYLFTQLPQTQTEKRILSRLIDERNQRMAQRIQKLLITDKELPFVAVGALHLFGSQGLIALFEAQGFTARQI